MYIYIKVPKQKAFSSLGALLRIKKVHIQQGARVRKGQLLITLEREGDLKEKQIQSSHSGWLTAVRKTKGEVKPGDLLVILNICESAEYCLSETECNPETELGQNSRRALEREGEARYGQFSKNLIEASSGYSTGPKQVLLSLMIHPLLSQAKPGVHPKLSAHAAENPQAQEYFNEVQHDLELSKQLDPKLQNQLQSTLSLGAAPTLKR